MKYHIEFDVEFRKNPYSGLYIALEGIDGSGKSLQTTRLKEYFVSKGRTVVTTREPRKKEGLIAEINQKILHGDLQIPKAAFQYLFTADRVMHHEDLVIPALKRGEVVISDRSFWSAIPYGVIDNQEKFDYGRVKFILVAQGILTMYHQFIAPDFTFYLDIPVDVSLGRLPRRTEERKEIYEQKELIEKVYTGYKWLIEEFPDMFCVIDAQKPIEEVTKDMVKTIEQKEPGVRNKDT